MKEVIVSFLALTGSFFIFVAALGMLTMPDLYLRISASTKAVTLGVGTLLLAVAVHFLEVQVFTECLAAILFLFLTTPIAAHIITRVSYMLGIKMWKHSRYDDLKGHITKHSPDENKDVEE